MSTEDSTEDCLKAQEDELEALRAIFPDDLVLRGRDGEGESGPPRPPRPATAWYSFRLRGEGIPFLLNITLPPTYPDLSTPDFSVGYDKKDGLARLHAVQEEALVGVAARAARAGLGSPSVYSSIQASREFLDGHGLAQAAVALLGDDCLALVLQFAASTREEVDAVRTALPVCRAAAGSNALWERICRMRWEGKFGYARRMRRAARRSDEAGGSDEHFWMRLYEAEERDSRRTRVRARELSHMRFDFRQWFSLQDFRNQPNNMRDLLPTGLRRSISRDVVFAEGGEMRSSQGWVSTRRWTLKNNEILWTAPSGSSVECFRISRLPDWGWCLSGNDFVMRSISDDVVIADWWDLTSKIIIEERCAWVAPTRAPHEYNYREVPDDEAIKATLDW